MLVYGRVRLGRIARSCIAVWLISAFLLLGGGNPALARDMNCTVFDELATLVHLSELFLDNVETGANPKARAKLTRFLKNTSVVELRMRLNDNGLNSISGATSKFMAQQKTLLKIRAIGGQFKAAETARKLRLRAKLDAYRRELVALPCLDGNGRSVVGTFTDENYLVSSKVASIGAITVLLLGVAAFLIFDRINKLNSRKKKRFVCNASCLVHPADQEEVIEAQIIDVSQLGAKVKSEVTCPVGAEVEVNVPEKTLVYPDHSVTYAGWSIPARVLWRNGNYFGVEFKTLMERAQLDQLVQAG
ncbi:PilZ domain-containing protein [Pseudophaeobacter sp.]|uniref:PilZ domain-containing protein n=1 Tax=Pseudophaeobacter sp. TaxID=1971739 RepID=UPI0032988183